MTEKTFTFSEVRNMVDTFTPAAAMVDGDVVVEPSGRDRLGWEAKHNLMVHMNETTFSYERGKFRCSVRGDIYEKLVQKDDDGNLHCNLVFRKNKEWLYGVTRMQVLL